MTHVYFLHKKSQALSKFQEYLSMAERQAGKQLKQLRTDGAGELNSSEFLEFCAEQGIVKQVTVPHSSHMNGIAENKHQALQYQAQTMLLHANLSTAYWAEAINTANYVLNKLPSTAIGGKIPYTVWTGRFPTGGDESIQIAQSPDACHQVL